MNSLRAFFLKNLGLKSVSLLLAFFLWHQVASQRTQRTVQRTVFGVPVEFVNLPPDMEISNDPPRRVDVVLRSDRGSATIDEKQLTAVVDLRSAQPGLRDVLLTETNINRPTGLEILRIDPSRFRLKLETTRMKLVKVEPDPTGEPAEGFQVTSVRVVPPEVFVSGPESHIQKATRAQTGPIDVSGRRETFTEISFVDLDDPRLRVDPETSSVTVVVTIEEKRRDIVVRGVRVRVEPEETPHRIYTKTLDLLGTVPLSFDEPLRPEMFEAVVDFSALEPRRQPYELVPIITIPEEYAEDFRLSDFKPATVKVRKGG